MYPENKVRLWLKREVDPVHNTIRWLQTYQGPKPSYREYSDGHYYIIVSDITMMSHMPHGIPNPLQLHCLSIACSGWHPKENTKAQHYWPFVRGIHQSLVDSPHKGPVMRKVSHVMTSSWFTWMSLKQHPHYDWHMAWWQYSLRPQSDKVFTLIDIDSCWHWWNWWSIANQ